MASDALFGWDLTFKTVEKDIRQKTDVIMAFVHWNMTKRGFRNIGIGDQRSVSGDEAKSELLPRGWNDKEIYSLRYLFDDKLYLLHGLMADENFIVNLVRSEDLAVTNLAVKIEDTVQDINGTIENMLPNYKDLMHIIKRDLIDSITAHSTVNTQTQTTQRSIPADDLLRETPILRPDILPENPNLWEPPPNIRNVGRSDLDPFAPPGGGMLFNPFRPNRDIENPGLGIPGGLPRGAVPPGARFDPFGPPGVGPLPGRRPPPPDADHFPPPGFNDHMFL